VIRVAPKSKLTCSSLLSHICGMLLCEEEVTGECRTVPHCRSHQQPHKLMRTSRYAESDMQQRSPCALSASEFKSGNRTAPHCRAHQSCQTGGDRTAHSWSPMLTRPQCHTDTITAKAYTVNCQYKSSLPYCDVSPVADQGVVGTASYSYRSRLGSHQRPSCELNARKVP